LHLCYDLASIIHTEALSSGIVQHYEKTIAVVRFWTDQLKRAIMTRYGPVGNDVNTVRKLLHHSKQVVRHKKGIDLVTHKFI
jgi:hypothetical protein